MSQIIISDIRIDVIRKDIKNMYLAVYPPKGKVRISVPKRVNSDTIRLFAISKLGWIKRSQRKFKEQERQSKREYKSRESHYFQGKRYLLNVIETKEKNRIAIRNKTSIIMYVVKDTSLEKRHKLMNEWYRESLKKLIPEILLKWEKIIGVQTTECKIKIMKTKWGSCNIHKRRLWINLELAKKPTKCLEYIIVHELVHLLERNHNERFINYINTFLPNWKKLKLELNRLPISHANWKY